MKEVRSATWEDCGTASVCDRHCEAWKEAERGHLGALLLPGHEAWAQMSEPVTLECRSEPHS